MRMVRHVGLGAALALALIACAALEVPASDPLIGEWTVSAIDATAPTGALTVNFDETSRISGSAGCNRFTGAYSFDETAGTLTVSPLGVTRMYCSAPGVMEQERRLITALQAATTVETTADGAKALKSATGQVLLRRRSAVAVASTPTPAKPPEPVAAPTTTAPPATAAPAAAGPATVAAPAAPEVAGQVIASGELFILERVALPPNAQVRIQLRDVSRAGAPAIVLAQQEFAAGTGGTWPFTIAAPANVVPANARLTVFAQILSAGRLLFITDTNNPVSVSGTNAAMRIRLVNAAPTPVSPPPPAAQPAVATPPPAPASPAPVAAAPAAATPAAPTLAGGPGTPAPARYRCGTETIEVAFDGAMAWLNTPDGVLAVPRVNPSDDPFAQRMYSNSRLTFIQDQPSANGGRVQFARGRLALQACAKVE